MRGGVLFKRSIEELLRDEVHHCSVTNPIKDFSESRDRRWRGNCLRFISGEHAPSCVVRVHRPALSPLISSNYSTAPPD
ncbi:hypothetical protein EVAR_92525_1 [Eumeta japonica]|uniref:Uncharacterized protein n=1 Tax=Eumeta variegata TaxID=151549 RepID=A0A4C1T728_EUMVA|nr:hypothetical protein EVAR_92525_1 [Eumeta japonica]